MRRSLAIATLLTLTTCVHGSRAVAVEMPVQSVQVAGKDAVVRLQVPTDWRPLAPSAARAEFLGPDNRSRAYVRVMPAEKDARHCPALAKQYGQEYIRAWGGPPRTRVVQKTSVEDRYEFELRRVDPKPDGEVIWGRVVCREGALAIVSCTVPGTRAGELQSECQEIIDSLEIHAKRNEPGTDRSLDPDDFQVAQQHEIDLGTQEP